MRALVAAVLALALVVAAVAPHVHAHAGSGDECAVCTLRHTAPPRSEIPDVAPAVVVSGDPSGAPGLPPVSGAPLGAVPGQSPPAAA
jgi:hypothetical protein